MLAILTPGCLDSLGVGALVAWLGDGSAGLKPGPPCQIVKVGPGFSRAALLAAFGWVALLATEATGSALPLPLMAIKQTLQAVVFAWIVMRAAEGFDGTLGRFLSAGPTAYLGQISYGLYLAHGFAGELLATFGIASASLPEPFRLLTLAGVTVAAASLSWHLLERPLNALKSRVPYRSEALPTGVALGTTPAALR